MFVKLLSIQPVQLEKVCQFLSTKDEFISLLSKRSHILGIEKVMGGSCAEFRIFKPKGSGSGMAEERDPGVQCGQCSELTCIR